MSNEPNWQPIEMLPVMADAVNEMYQSSKALLESLEVARTKPHVMDDETINRVFQVHSEQLKLNPIYIEQVNRWKQESSNHSTSSLLDDIELKLTELKPIDVLILGIAKEISGSTIDKIMEMGDVELAIKTLTKNR